MTNPTEANVTTRGGGMFPDVKHVLGLAIMATIIFCSVFLIGLSYLNIRDVYGGVLWAKVISLFALAGFGQSEALNFYLKYHPASGVSLVSLLNKIGIVLTGICVVAVAMKLLMLESKLKPAQDAPLLLLSAIQDHSEVIAFLPILYFAAIDLLMWLGAREGPEIGRVCFVVADLPLLMPIMIIFFFTVILKLYGGDDFHILIGGVTIMFILASIVLNECSRSLLSSHWNLLTELKKSESDDAT
jgi:hypothetical protein